MSKDKNRNFQWKLLSALILIFIYIGISSIPWMGEENYRWIFDAGTRLIALVSIYLVMFFEKNLYKPKIGFHPQFWPILLLTCSNLFIFLLFPEDRYGSQGMEGLYKSAVVTLLTALCEETVFRYALLPALKSKFNTHLTILIGSAIFASSHLFNLFSSSPSAVFAQIGYTFILGLICSFFFLCDDFPLSIIFHFLFNFLETDLYLALGGSEWNYKFFAINIAFGLLFGGYAFYCYWAKFIKRKPNP